MSDREPRKRPAFEPVARLAAPTRYDPTMPRPASTVAGAVLVLARAVAAVLWILSFSLGWSGWLQDLAAAFSGDASASASLSDGATSLILTTVVAVVGLGALIEATLGVLILAGLNWPRVLVMIFSVGSITSSFVGWWVAGEQIRFGTTFLTLALDVLILLALSSRSSAAYARRHERR